MLSTGAAYPLGPLSPHGPLSLSKGEPVESSLVDSNP